MMVGFDRRGPPCVVRKMKGRQRVGSVSLRAVTPPFAGGTFRVRVAGCRVQGAGCRVQGAGCRVQGAGCRVQDEGCRVQDAG